jgi:hypothetical protein
MTSSPASLRDHPFFRETPESLELLRRVNRLARALTIYQANALAAACREPLEYRGRHWWGSGCAIPAPAARALLRKGLAQASVNGRSITATDLGHSVWRKVKFLVIP